MGKIFEQTFHQRIYMENKYTNEKYSMSLVIKLQIRNVNKNHNEILLHTHYND